MSEIIKQKVSDEESPVTRSTISSLGLDENMDLDSLDLTKIPGYFKNKHSHQIQNVMDFIIKLRKTAVLTKFFSSSDLNFAGLQDLFTEFYDRISKQLQLEDSIAKDHKLQLAEIHEVVMFQLHQEFFANQQPS